MYTNEKSHGTVKVYPNTSAIKQMALCDSRHITPNTVCSTPDKEEIKPQIFSDSGKIGNDELYLALITLLLFTDFSDDAVFSVILGLLLLS